MNIASLVMTTLDIFLLCILCYMLIFFYRTRTALRKEIQSLQWDDPRKTKVQSSIDSSSNTLIATAAVLILIVRIIPLIFEHLNIDTATKIPAACGIAIVYMLLSVGVSTSRLRKR